MRRPSLIFVFYAGLLALIVSSCGTASEQPPGTATNVPTALPTATAPAPAQPLPSPTIDFASSMETFQAATFTTSTEIDNKYFPLEPGTQYVFDGFTQEADKSIPHSIVYTVTDLTKLIAGVRTVVVWILDYADGNLVEAEISFYAQDKDGAVWYLGEYPEVYEGGELVEAPAWIPGLKGARAGIVMQADPHPGMPSYSQGWGPAVGWADRGQVIKAGQQVCVPHDCYGEVLVTQEFSQSEPDAFQVKYYAPGVGNVKVGWRGEDASKETLELTGLKHLTPEELAHVRTQALELEKRAYSTSREVYALTKISEYPPGTPAQAIDPSQPPPVEFPTAPVLSAGISPEVVVYASDMPESALFELDKSDDPASPGGKFIGLPNNGNVLDPPPQDDPHLIFQVKVVGGIPYRCWIHMKVGQAQGSSQANLIWVQLSNALDTANREFLKPGTASYLVAQGPEQAGWRWVSCDLQGESSPSLIRFSSTGEITVRVQAGMEGVGFDQFLLSPEKYLESPPPQPIVQK